MKLNLHMINSCELIAQRLINYYYFTPYIMKDSERIIVVFCNIGKEKVMRIFFIGALHTSIEIQTSFEIFRYRIITTFSTFIKDLNCREPAFS